MAGRVSVNQTIMAAADLLAEPSLTLCQKVLRELWCTPGQAFADDPNTIVISVARADFPMGQLCEQLAKVAAVNPVIFKEYQRIHILKIQALTNHLTKRFVHLLCSFQLHVPIVAFLTAQLNGITRTQFVIYDRLDLCC